MPQASNNEFVTRCPFCKKNNRILTSDLRDQVLGVGVDPYIFLQFCTECDNHIGWWKARTTRTPGVIEMLYMDVRVPDTWKSCIYMVPPRR